MLKMLITIILAAAAVAQTTRTVTLSWNDTINPAGTTYNVYRAPGSCNASSAFVKVNASPIAAKTYDDSGVSPGTYCYVARAELAGAESTDSNQAGALVRPFPPNGVTVTVKDAAPFAQPAP